LGFPDNRQHVGGKSIRLSFDAGGTGCLSGLSTRMIGTGFPAFLRRLLFAAKPPTLLRCKMSVECRRKMSAFSQPSVGGFFLRITT
jgi:hypothetical protein